MEIIYCTCSVLCVGSMNGVLCVVLRGCLCRVCGCLWSRAAKYCDLCKGKEMFAMASDHR